MRFRRAGETHAAQVFIALSVLNGLAARVAPALRFFITLLQSRKALIAEIRIASNACRKLEIKAIKSATPTDNIKVQAPIGAVSTKLAR